MTAPAIPGRITLPQAKRAQTLAQLAFLEATGVSRMSPRQVAAVVRACSPIEDEGARQAAWDAYFASVQAEIRADRSSVKALEALLGGES
jgi:hypothetical protein